MFFFGKQNDNLQQFLEIVRRNETDLQDNPTRVYLPTPSLPES